MKKKRILTGLLGAAIILTCVPHASAAANSFPDVGEKNWCYAYVTDLATKGIVTGLPDGNYGPDQNVTRGSVAKLLWEAMKHNGTAIPTENTTSTLAASGWSAPYINALADKGILVAAEYPNGSFVEGQPMSRLETIKAVVRAYLMATPTAKLPTSPTLTFTDAADIPVAAQPLVAMGVESGIIKGITVAGTSGGATRFAPNDPIQRSTAATMVSRFLEVVGEAVNKPPVVGPEITTVDGEKVEWLMAPTLEGESSQFRYQFSDGMCAFESNGKYGYINDMGEVAIQPTFTGNAREFSYGYAIARREDGQYGFIDKTGKWVIEPIYDWALPFSKDGDIVCASVGYDNWWSPDSQGTFHDANLNVIPERKFPERDLDLVALEKKYEGTDYSVDEFNDAGIAVISKPDPERPGANLRGVINRDGKILVQPQYRFAITYGDYIVVEKQMNYGNTGRMHCFVVDGNGKTVYEYYSGGGTHTDDNAMVARGYGDGLFVCEDEHSSQLRGYMLPNGTVVIEPIFDIAEDFSDGLAWVKYQGKWGIIKRPADI